MIKKQTTATIAVIAATLLVFAAGCEKAAEKAMEIAIERGAAQDGHDVKADIDLSSGTFTIRGESGEQIEFKQSEDGSVVVRGPEGQMVMSGDGDAFTIAGEEGAMTMTAGVKAAIPEGFPADVPVYDGLTLNFASSMPGDGAFSVSGQTKDGPEKVAGFYKDALTGQGWTEQATMTQPQMTFMGFTKDDRNLTINIESSTEDTNVTIAVH